MNESHEEQKYHQEKNTKFTELLKDEKLKSKIVKENDLKSNHHVDMLVSRQHSLTAPSIIKYI